MSKPTHINVERCYDCPFWDRIDAMPAIGGCEHPSYGAARPVKLEQPPPDWCPLRGQPTIITGPSVGLRLAVEEPDGRP